jgi:hypothetical protein|tara:strand:- start:1829 stop:2752 length:924 start_codon:yes stop_codon:yes gene_type:complete
MAYLTGYQYYENAGATPENANWGSYQYVSLSDIVKNFMMMYTGQDKLLANVSRAQIIFHAKRGIQELNYDAFKEIKALELDVCDDLRFILPNDYVNWVRISMFKDGCLYPLTENIQINSAKAYLQDNDCNILFDELGNIIQPEQSGLDIGRINKTNKSIYLNEGSKYHGQEAYLIDNRYYFDFPIGARYGLNSETANSNPTFKIDNKGGVINFSSGMGGETCIVEYISDGMEGGDDSLVSVNKLFEEYIYAYIKYMLINSRVGIQEYVVRRSQKDKSTLLRNAKIRMSNIHPGRLLMNLRAQGNIIK